MKQTLLLPIIIILFVIPCAAQKKSQKSTSPSQAQKFNEIIWTDNTALSLYIDRFARTLRKKPTAKAYIIVYESPLINEREPFANIVLRNARRFLVEFNKISPKRIVGVEGGFREEIMIELFIVPKGAVPPVPTPTVDANGGKLKQ